MNAREETGEALRELRDLVRGVYPPILADRGLAGGIESLADHAASGPHGIAVNVDLAEGLPFDGDLSLVSPPGGPTLLHVELSCAS